MLGTTSKAINLLESGFLEVVRVTKKANLVYNKYQAGSDSCMLLMKHCNNNFLCWI